MAMHFHPSLIPLALLLAACAGADRVRPDTPAKSAAPASAPAPAEAAAPADGSAPGEQWAKVGEVWQAGQVPRIQTLRQAVAESALDEAAKKKAGDALLAYEAELRRMIAEARKDPSKAGAVLEKMRAFQEEQAPALRRLFTDEQYKAVGRRNQGIEIESTALSSDPQAFVKDLDDGFKLTAEQKARITPSTDRLAEKIKALKALMADADHTGDPKARGEKWMDGVDEIFALAMDARARIREALTPEQRKQFDAGFRYDHPDPVEKPRSTSAPDGRATRPDK